jgi:hypothetical protein
MEAVCFNRKPVCGNILDVDLRIGRSGQIAVSSSREFLSGGVKWKNTVCSIGV